VLAQIASIAAPDTILRWYRELVSRKYSEKKRGPGWPGKAAEMVRLLVEMATQDNSARARRVPADVHESSIAKACAA
jgi:hypothetical protein